MCRRFLFVCIAIFLEAVCFSALGAEHPATLPLAVRPCTVCHGANGVSKDSFVPNLAGQRVEYLVKQTLEMQLLARLRFGLDLDEDHDPYATSPSRLTDHRNNPHMDRQLAELDHASIQAISEYFSSRPRVCAPPGTPRGNPPARLISHCASCHGRDGTSDLPYVPHLAGQHRFYLVEQIRLFRTDEHKLFFPPSNITRSNPAMSPQMALISKKQLDDLALWFANSPCAEKK
jgi:cytochrome c553